MGKSDTYDINWYDDPEVWTDPQGQSNAIVIEVQDKSGDLQYNVTFFMTTGTIRVQGSKFMYFARKHFPVLRDIFNKLLEHFGDSPTPHNEVMFDTETDTVLSELDNTVLSQNDNEDDTSVKSFAASHPDDTDDETSVKSTASMCDTTLLNTPSASSLDRLDVNFKNALMKLENSHSNDIDKVITAITTSKESCLLAISKIHLASPQDHDISSCQAKIRALNEEVKLLESKLKIERSKSELVVLQYEESLKHEKALLEQTRSELHKMVLNANSEADFNAERLKVKNEEICTLHSSTQELSSKLDRANDEILSLKMQLSASLDQNFSKVPHHDNWREPSKPNVLLMGTSNIKGINEDKLTQSANVHKVIKYTMAETKQYLDTSTDSPDLVVLHCLTNDLKTMSPQTCVDELESVLSIIHSKWNPIKIVISLATPRIDNLTYHTNGLIINALIKQKVSCESSISYCEHVNMLQNGNPNPDLLNDDKYHLSPKGISHLASNLKKSIHDALEIPVQPPRERSRSRVRRGRGRGRGRF